MINALSNIKHKDSNNFYLLAGPCAIEGEGMAFKIAEKIKLITESLKIPFIFKGSYRKANRSRLDSFTGIGNKQSLEILKKVGSHFNIPTVTDIHSTKEADMAAKYVDVLQIPAFLSRQTDLLLAAGETQKPVNIKKGQFLSPKDMMKVAEKVSSTGNDNIFLCERGTSFGYNTLVNDFRGLEIMAETGYPVIFDATHSVQQPSILGEKSGGERQFIPSLSRAACAIGVSGLFIETHENPDVAPSDGANMLNINDLPNLIPTLLSIDNVIKNKA